MYTTSLIIITYFIINNNIFDIICKISLLQNIYQKTIRNKNQNFSKTVFYYVTTYRGECVCSHQTNIFDSRFSNYQSSARHYNLRGFKTANKTCTFSAVVCWRTTTNPVEAVSAVRAHCFRDE